MMSSAAFRLALILLAVNLPTAFGAETAPKNEVIVMGMIHGSHRRSGPFDIDHLKQIIREVKPDYVLTEIPPDRLPTAAQQFKESGTITESRVRVFPEYTDALFPLTKEMPFQIVPCAAWTTQMNDSRKATLTKLRETHAEQSREVRVAQNKASQQIAELGNPNDPQIIHTDAYDALVKTGMEPYDRHFNDAIGAGGWTNINAGHYSHIAKALDKHKGEGKRFLVTFGSWHKYYIKEQLRKRDDIQLVSLTKFLPPATQTQDEAEQLLANFAKQWDESKWETLFRGKTYMRPTTANEWKPRMTALRSLVLLGEKAVPALTKALDSKDEPTRILAAQALGFLAPSANIDRLKIAATKDDSAAVRLYSVDALGMSGKSADMDWAELSKPERDRDVRKHMNYARLRGDNAIAKDVIASLQKWDPATMDSAKVGSPAPEFQLKTIDGKTVSLSDYRDKQPVVLLFLYGDT